MPQTAVMIPRPWSFVTLSFKNIMAIVMVTTDKADAIGVINIASPIVIPKLTMASAPVSKKPINTMINFVLVVALVK